MAATQFVFCAVNADIPAVFTEGATVETETPSGSNAATTAASTASQTFCRVTTDTDVYVSFGAAPDASSDTIRFLLLAGNTEYFRIPAGSKGAVVEA